MDAPVLLDHLQQIEDAVTSAMSAVDDDPSDAEDLLAGALPLIETLRMLICEIPPKRKRKRT